jgi:hypothetical protein
MNHATNYDNDQEPASRRSSRRYVLLIVGIIGGVLCVILLVCGGIIYLGARTVVPAWRSITMADEIQASDMAADKFMKLIARGGVEPAYAGTTQGFQSRQTLEQFRDLVDKNPLLKDYQWGISPENHEWMALDGDFDPDKNTYRGTILSEKGKAMSFTVVTVKDGQSWKVDRFTIP